jgi:type VI secretion system protein ImpF
MARGELERTVQQSLLDRLTDDEPRVAADAPMTWAQSVRAFKAGVRRDLEWLLNTRRTAELAPEHLVEVGRSLHHYGLSDLTSLSKDSESDRERLLHWVEDVIATYEPRLANVRVTLAEGQPADAHRRELHFVIHGVLRMDPSPEQVAFDTVLEFASGDVEIRGAAGA